MELLSRVAIVTGATSGVGKAIARRFVEEGAMVALIGRSDDTGRAAESELCALAQAQGAGGCLYVHADVGNGDEVRAACAAITARWPQVDILVNNAAVMKTVALVDMEEADWDQTIAVNLKGAFLMSKYALPVMREQGAIINISSVHAVATDPLSAAYSASKGGLEALTRAMSLECYPRHIRVNALRLGAVDTPMLWNNPQVKSGEEKIEPRDVGRPEDIAEAALFLATPRSSFISGTVLTIDGGRLSILASHSK